MEQVQTTTVVQNNQKEQKPDKGIYFFNPYDTTSIANAVYLKHCGKQVRDTMANNTDIINDGGNIFYIGFKPKLYIKEHRVVNKKIKEKTHYMSDEEMYVDDLDINRVIWSFKKFNDKDSYLELLEFVYNNIDNVLRWLHSTTADLVLINKTGNYLEAVKKVKSKFKPYMEIDNNLLINGNKSAVNRCYNPMEALVMNRIAKISGYNIWHEQCTSLGIIVYN